MTKKETKEKRIDDILAAAVEVFVEKGYENTSMDLIASKAGISKGGLYHHFLSKDMVLLHANQKLLEPVEALMLKSKNTPSAKDALKTYIQDYLTYWIERKKELLFFILSMTKAMSSIDIFKIYERFVEEYLLFFEELYKKGAEAGEFVPHDKRSNAVALMSAMDGVLIYMVLDKKIKLEDTIKGFQTRFVDDFSVAGEP